MLQKWIQHLEANGFTVIDHVETNMSAVKQISVSLHDSRLVTPR
jgi:hypothetical protein